MGCQQHTIEIIQNTFSGIGSEDENDDEYDECGISEYTAS